MAGVLPYFAMMLAISWDFAAPLPGNEAPTFTKWLHDFCHVFWLPGLVSVSVFVGGLYLSHPEIFTKRKPNEAPGPTATAAKAPAAQEPRQP